MQVGHTAAVVTWLADVFFLPTAYNGIQSPTPASQIAGTSCWQSLADSARILLVSTDSRGARESITPYLPPSPF
jgi:hypothetical protein